MSRGLRAAAFLRLSTCIERFTWPINGQSVWERFPEGCRFTQLNWEPFRKGRRFTPLNREWFREVPEFAHSRWEPFREGCRFTHLNRERLPTGCCIAHSRSERPPRNGDATPTLSRQHPRPDRRRERVAAVELGGQALEDLARTAGAGVGLPGVVATPVVASGGGVEAPGRQRRVIDVEVARRRLEPRPRPVKLARRQRHLDADRAAERQVGPLAATDGQLAEAIGFALFGF